MIRRLRVWCAVAAVGAALAGCADGSPSGPGGNEVPVIAISDTTISSMSSAAAGSSSEAFLVGTGTRSTAYVSLPPGSIPLGRGVVITNLRTGFSIAQPMTNGGFDPIEIEARPGDAIETRVDLSTGGSDRFTEHVPLRVSPAIVRTVPPRKKKDVPLNARLMIVFTEPVHSTTIATGIRLMQGDAVVAGTATLDVSGVAVTFSPEGMLQPLTDYRIVVDGVRDLDGDAIEGRFESVFTTDANPPTSEATHVAIYTDGPFFEGAFTGLNALLVNADGDGLVVSATWTSSDTTIVTIAPREGTAFALARAVGTATIRATVGNQTASITASVTTLAADSIQIIGPLEAYVGDTVTLSVRAFRKTDLGPRELWGLATWTIQDSSKAAMIASGPAPWGQYLYYVVARDTGATTVTAAAFGKTAAVTLQISHPATSMKALGFEPVAINDSGQVAGVWQTPSGMHPVFYNAGALTDLGVLPGYNDCRSTAINNRGHIVGYCRGSQAGVVRAFIWTSGALTDLGSLPGAEWSYARDINDSGQVVGYARGSAKSVRAITWRAGSIRELPHPAFGGSAALGINNAGQIVGWTSNGDMYTAVLWEGESLMPLGLTGMGLEVNRAGEIVVTDFYNSWLWRSGTATDLMMYAYGITDSGLVYGGTDGGRPTVWEAGTERDLGTIPKNAVGWVTGANNRGQAVGVVNGVGVRWDLTPTAALRAPARSP